MLNYAGQFHRPSTKNRTLAILETLAGESELSQSTLGERTGLSGAMTNKYLKELQTRDLVTARPVNAKSYKYLLTDDGERLRRELLGDYCAEIVRSYTAIKTLVRNKLADLSRQGLSHLVLFGASETCEIVLSALRETDFTVLALVDNNPDKHGLLLAGHAVFPPAILESIRCDAVVITSFGQGDEIFEQLRPLTTERAIPVIRL